MIIFEPLQFNRADAVREKLKSLGIRQADVDAAIKHARREHLRTALAEGLSTKEADYKPLSASEIKNEVVSVIACHEFVPH